jgi:hypothetical protein
MFDLKITITGICAFVENSLGTGPRVLVVMPSTDVDRNAADDEPLCPHESYLEQGLTRFPLKGYRVSFDVQEDGLLNLPIPLPLPIATSDNVGLINFGDSGYPGDPDPDMVSVSSVPKAPVITQIELENGSIGFIPEGRKWQLNTARPGVAVAHEVVVTLAQLKSASMILKAFNGSQSTVDLTPATTASKVELKIVNTCRRSISPVSDPHRDRDFKWYYELLAPAIGILSDDLPIPRTGVSLIGGNNCFPTRLGVAQIQ